METVTSGALEREDNSNPVKTVTSGTQEREDNSNSVVIRETIPEKQPEEHSLGLRATSSPDKEVRLIIGQDEAPVASMKALQAEMKSGQRLQLIVGSPDSKTELNYEGTPGSVMSCNVTGEEEEAVKIRFRVTISEEKISGFSRSRKGQNLCRYLQKQTHRGGGATLT